MFSRKSVSTFSKLVKDKPVGDDSAFDDVDDADVSDKLGDSQGEFITIFQLSLKTIFLSMRSLTM